MLKIDPFELYSVVTGSVRLDGGAMFGVVPKVLWDKVTDPDELNRIPLTTRTLVAVDRSSDRVILVDTGCGTKWDAKSADRYAVSYDEKAIPGVLAEIGLSTEQVTDVVVTHLHFDHNGGLTYWYDEPGGPTRLRYPDARHWIHKTHWEHAQQPHEKDKASFLNQDFEALREAKGLELVEGDSPEPPFDGVEWFVSYGHTPAQLHPIFGTGFEHLMFVGDIVPTIAHLRPSWVMAYDVEPVRTMSEKETVFRRCLDAGLLLAFPHDPQHGGVAIDGTDQRPIVSRPLPL